MVSLHLAYTLFNHTHVRIIPMLVQWMFEYSGTETENLMNMFHRTVLNTRSENRNLIWSHVTTMAILLSGVCDLWKKAEKPISEKYQSCNFTDPCILMEKLNNMYYHSDSLKRDQYMTDMQDVYDQYFTPLSAFVFALEADSQTHQNSTFLEKLTKRLRHSPEKDEKSKNIEALYRRLKKITTLKLLDKMYDNLHIFRKGSRKGNFSDEVMEIYDILTGNIEAYSECLSKFPDLMKKDPEKLYLSPEMEKDWKKSGLILNTEFNDVPLIVIFRRIFIRKSLLFSLNNDNIMFVISNIASLIQCIISQLTIFLLFSSYPIVPFSLAFTIEVSAYHSYKKVFGCICRIKKKLFMLKLIKKYKMQFQLRFATMRMYKRRMRKIQTP